MNISLASKTAIVTGAGRGIGRAIAKKLAGAGAAVVLVDVDQSALEETRSVLQGARTHLVATDLTVPEAPDAIVKQTLAQFGSIDVIVNNAGYTWDSVIQKTSDEQMQSMLEIHVIAPFRLLRAASEWLRQTAKREMGDDAIVIRKVVNITSISGLEGNAGQIAYASGKAAVAGLTKTLAKEWGRYNITVNAVGFGLIDTRLIKPMEDPETHVQVGEKRVRVGMQAQLREQLPKMIPLGRLGTPDDAANAVFFFCCPLSDYVTGEVLLCSGGFHF